LPIPASITWRHYHHCAFIALNAIPSGAARWLNYAVFKLATRPLMKAYRLAEIVNHN